MFKTWNEIRPTLSSVIDRAYWFFVGFALAMVLTSCSTPKHTGELLSSRSASYLRGVSVMIESDEGYGSGVIVGPNLVLTCAHVVEVEEEEELPFPFITLTSTNASAAFKPTIATNVIVWDFVSGEKKAVPATVIAYDHDKDLALLRVSQLYGTPARFANYTPSLGQWLWHVGCFNGPPGQESLSAGVFSFTNRKCEGELYDQTTCSSSPGSSGGGVFDCDGNCIGILARTINRGATANLVVPARVVVPWLRKNAP